MCAPAAGALKATLGSIESTVKLTTAVVAFPAGSVARTLTL